MKVVVIGAGPAGSVAAAILAREGVDTTVVERARFGRDKVGESLQPATFALLEEHLGLGEAIASQGFGRKYGAVYVWGESRLPWSVLFDERLEGSIEQMTEAELLAGDYEHAWNVSRARFDALLATTAEQSGARMLWETEVVRPLLDDGRVVGVQTSDGPIDADIVIDASGQRCVLGRAFKLTRLVSDLQATATWAHFDGAGGLPGALSRHVQWVITVPAGWIWFIPISAERTSVGLVSRRGTRVDEAAFREAVAAFPLDDATPVTDDRGKWLHHARDWSFTHKRFAGPGWLMAGDAACFVDPILSGGVDLAVRTACRAALMLLRIRDGEAHEALAKAYETTLGREYRAYLRLARYWYGNNRSVEGFFWEAHRELAGEIADKTTPLRAFVYLTTGKYAADKHLKVFRRWQEEKMFRALGVDKKGLR